MLIKKRSYRNELRWDTNTEILSQKWQCGWVKLTPKLIRGVNLSHNPIPMPMIFLHIVTEMALM